MTPLQVREDVLTRKHVCLRIASVVLTYLISISGADVVAKEIIFAAQQNNCNIMNCAAVIAATACMALDIANEDAAGALGCVNGGAQAVCSPARLRK